MSFRLFIYCCWRCGGCGAYVGWLLGRIPSIENPVGLQAVRGLFLGAMVALSLGLIDALWNTSRGQLVQVVLRVLTAVAVGCLGGLLGGTIGQALYGRLQLSLFLIVGWTITGLLIGPAPGVFDILARLMRD